jgi:hypothetical protein
LKFEKDTKIVIAMETEIKMETKLELEIFELRGFLEFCGVDLIE